MTAEEDYQQLVDNYAAHMRAVAEAKGKNPDEVVSVKPHYTTVLRKKDEA